MNLEQLTFPYLFHVQGFGFTSIIFSFVQEYIFSPHLAPLSKSPDVNERLFTDFIRF